MTPEAELIASGILIHATDIRYSRAFCDLFTSSETIKMLLCT